MNHDFATFLRTQRRQRKLSQAELARQAQISERTIRYWETGMSSPGRWELESILTALALTPPERAHALALLPTPRGMNLSRQEAHSSPALTADLGPMPTLGDLLQAMRLRRGLSQGQMAAALKIARTTILRWETTGIQPSVENLERMCALLGAYPEERAALSSRRVQMWQSTSQPSLEECAEQVDALDKDGMGIQSPLVDLRALALKRQLWPLASQSQKALRLLARVQIIHASWLMLHDRKGEAEVFIRRSLHTLRGQRATEPFWQAVVNLAAQFANENGDDQASLETIKQWLPLFPRELQATLWCDMALYAGRAQQHQEAAFYLDRAQEVLPYSRDPQGMTEHYYPLTCSRIFLAVKRPMEALDRLPAIPDATYGAAPRASYQLLWAEAFVEAGENDTAQRHLDQLNVLFAQYPQPRFQRKFQSLSARL